MIKEKKVKKVKKKGPIRFEAIVPITIVIALFWAYSVFFLDSNLRWATETAASYGYGAEVNIESMNLSFTDPSLSVSKIQVTNKDNPEENVVEIGTIKFELLWDALLRAKFLIPEAQISGIALYSKRKTPGKIYPVDESSEDSPGLASKIGDTVKENAEEQLAGNVFGDIAKVLEGSDPADQLKKIQSELKSEKKINEIQSALKSKEKEWNDRLKKLPKGREIKEIAAKVKATKIDQGNPQKAAGQIKALQSEIKKADGIIKTYQKGSTELTGDVGNFQKEIASIEAFIQKDIDDLQNRLQIPKIETESLTKTLFSKILGDKLQKVAGYMDTAKQYLPEKSKSGDKKKKPEFVPHPRSKGRTYKFPITVGYPLFWLKKAAISSAKSEGKSKGEFAGELLDLTSNPAYINKATLFNLDGSAPSQNIIGLALKMVLDNRDSKNFSTLDMKVNQHPFPGQEFSKSKDATFILNESIASSTIKAKFRGEQIDAVISDIIRNPKFETDAKSPILKEVLAKVTGDMKHLSIGAKIKGTFTKPKITLNSNLGKELAKGFKKHLAAKIAEARKKIRSIVDGKIGGKKADLTKQYSKMKNSLTGTLGKNQKEMNSAKSDLTNTFNDKKKIDKKGLENKAKKLLKKFKF